MCKNPVFISLIHGLALILSMLFLWSCQEEKAEEIKIDLSPTAIVLSPDSQKASFSLNCNGSGSLRLKTGTWARIESQTEFSAGVPVKIELSIQMNESENPREEILTVTSGSKNVNVLIYQEGIRSMFSTFDVIISDTAPASFSINSKDNWTAVRVDGFGNEVSWFELNAYSGAGKQDLTVKAVEKNLNVGDRTGMIKFMINGKAVFVNVIQKQTDALLLTADKYELTNRQGTFTVNIDTNVDIDYSIDDDCLNWLHSLETKGLNREQISFKVDANNLETVRVGHILFTGNAKSETITVVQAEKDILILGNDYAEISEEGGVIGIDLKTNVEYEIIFPDNTSWLSVSEDAAKPMSVRADRAYLKVEANPEYDDRSARVLFKDRNSSLSQTLIIKQSMLNAVILSMDTVRVSNKGETFIVPVQSNVDYKVSVDEQCSDWISWVRTKSLSSSEEAFTTSATSLSVDRQGLIVFSYGNKTSDSLIVVQPAKDSLVVSPHSLFPKFYGGETQFSIGTNVGYTLDYSSIPEWIQISDSGQYNEFILSTLPNLLPAQREAHIIFISEDKSVSDTLNVLQEARPTGTYLDQKYFGAYGLNGKDWAGLPVISQVSIVRNTSNYACRVLFPRQGSVIDFPTLSYNYKLGQKLTLKCNVYNDDIVAQSSYDVVVEQISDRAIWMRSESGECFIVKIAVRK